jgi:hypothetical protein
VQTINNKLYNYSKMPKTLEDYMTSEKRVQLAAQVGRLAQIYGNNFKKVEYICDSNINIPGAIAQVNIATMRLEKNLPTEDIIPEAVETARSLLLLDIAKDQLCDDGVPRLMALEITRRVLDKDVVGSRELTINE